MCDNHHNEDDKAEKSIDRRSVIKGMTAAGAAALTGCSGFTGKSSAESGSNPAHSVSGMSLTESGKKPKFLIVLGCWGGASILDSVLAMSESEVRAAGGDPNTINCFADQDVKKFSGSPFRAVDLQTSIAVLGNQTVVGKQSDFVRKHMQDMLVTQVENTSVNHGVAQQRSVNGNDAWDGRTLMDNVAESHGKNMAIANMNMGSGGFGAPGTDTRLPEYARQMTVTSPLYFPLGLHSTKGLKDAPDQELLGMARDLRTAGLEQGSEFYKTFKDSKAVQRWMNSRDRSMQSYENMDLISKLYFVEGASQGLTRNPESEKLTGLFPNYKIDSLDAEAIMAYLAITSGVSASVTISPTPSAVVGTSGLGEILNPPIAFDFSHSDHRGVQAMMWTRVLSIADRLIELLKQKEFDKATGESYWDRTLIYFATDFGRDKIRPPSAQAFGTGHHLNNANLIVSPMVKGNRFLGGIDYKTGLTHGFDLNSGAAKPGTIAREHVIYSGILQTLDVDTSPAKLPDVAAMKKS